MTHNLASMERKKQEKQLGAKQIMYCYDCNREHGFYLRRIDGKLEHWYSDFAKCVMVIVQC